jgi:hypothetical protein
MRFVIYAFLFIGLIHVGNIFYGPIIKNHMLEGKMISLSTESRLKADQYLLRDLHAFIEEKQIDIDKKNIYLQHPTPKTVVITAKYKVFCKFWMMEKEYEFAVTSDNTAHGILPDFSAY